MPLTTKKTFVLAIAITVIIVGGVLTQWGLLLDVAKLDPFGTQQWLFCEKVRIPRICEWLNSGP